MSRPLALWLIVSFYVPRVLGVKDTCEIRRRGFRLVIFEKKTTVIKTKRNRQLSFRNVLRLKYVTEYRIHCTVKLVGS